ncbi:hypothetical protein [Comamonas sp.]|uniref:hypothetical protein n=1 Tax=Comamonas sp. TaxID=34028 RepID=UPI00258723F2|nr:hypothetical protein [Comamonas sp.]
MKLSKSWLIAKLCLLLVMPFPAWSQALPTPQPENVNRAISGTMGNVMANRGFAANDPRVANTIARMSPALQGIAGSAAVITVGTVTAPGWISGAVAIGIGAVISYAVGVAVNAVVNWLFRTDGKIDQSGLESEKDPSGGISPGVPAWRSKQWVTRSTTEFIWGGDGFAVAREAEASYRAVNGLTPNTPSCTLAAGGQSAICGNSIATLYPEGPPGACPKGTFWVAGNCSPYGFLAPAGVPTVIGQTPQQAVNALPSAELGKDLNPRIIAALADRAWQSAASQPGYDGVPYPVSQPVTEADVQPWLNANPEIAPTVQDFVTPNPVSPTNPNPWAIPLDPKAPVIKPVVPNTGTTNPAAANPEANLGPDPGIGAPTLEAIPTAQQIANPILQLAPDLRGFQASGQSGVCPKPTIELYGTHVMDAHCKLIEDNKQVLQLAMAFAWAAMALFIVLSA